MSAKVVLGRSIAVLLTAVLTALGLVVTATPSAAFSTAPESDFASRVNSARAAAGLPALQLLPDLTSVARAHSERMGTSNTLYHNPNLSTDVTNWAFLAENVGYGGSVQAVHDALMASPGHRANILSATATELGVGVWISSTGRVWVTQVFRKPAVATAPATPIDERWFALGGSSGVLGSPTTGELALPDGRFRHFRGGSIYWSGATPASDVRGSIRDTWARLGWERSALGYPTTGELPAPDGRGRFNHFQNGSTYWTPTTGAHEVHGAIRGTWSRLGWERSPLGYPTSDELPTPDGRGRYNHFEQGSIYWSPATGAREVRGAIRGTWARLGWERNLGFPTSDELPTPDGRGRYNHFERGSVYWTPATGAREVRGAIRDAWARLGWERSALGFPLSDELVAPDRFGRFNHFENGSIYWTPDTGAHEVRGAIRSQWAALGWERGRLGYPTSDEYAVSGGRRTDFQGGSIIWDARTGATRVV